MIYDLISSVYDKINKDIDYSQWADFIEKIIGEQYFGGKPELILDLGCGTGKMTIELAKRGYDMTGVDYSPLMLDKARRAAERQLSENNILWLCQDMTSFELYGTVDVTVSCLDCINHLMSSGEVRECFELVHNYLSPNGLFIFDINGRKKFETVYGNNSYIMEDRKSFCTWQNYYNPKSKICDFYITLFRENENGMYDRYDEQQSEMMYTVKSIKNLLLKCGFEFIGAYSDFNFSVGTDEDERIYFAARCLK